MIPENREYRKILEILRKSEPTMTNPEEVENEVISRIMRTRAVHNQVFDFTEKLFGWVYIGWVRRTLVVTCIMIICVFLYQQTIILSQVKKISRQSVVITNELRSFPAEDAGKRLTILRLSNKLRSQEELRITEEQLEILIRSYDELELKYRNLLKIIDDNPELKAYIENRLNGNINKIPDL